MNWFEYTLRDGTVVEIGSVVPDGPIRGQLQIAHGMVEHLGRYETWMKRLASKGYYVFGHTMRGHARVGTIQPIERGVTSETYADDVMEVKRLMEKVDVPYVLFGHSMGSFVARYLFATEPSIHRVIVASTGTQPTAFLRAGAFIASRRNESHDHLLNELSFFGFDRHFQPSRRFSWISRSEATVEAYRTDPNCGFAPSSAFFKSLYELIDRAQRNERERTTGDVLFLYGTMDPVGHLGNDVPALAASYASRGIRTTLYRVEEGRHELLQEVNVQATYEMIERWLSYG
ncbi:MAG TPA: alpha/beta hydrolase [Savagea sp.]